MPANGKIAVDPDFYLVDDKYEPSDFQSYQTLREGKYWGPSDEQQFEALEAGHLVGVVMDSETNNPLFQAPIKNPKVSIVLRNFFFGGWISILIKISAFLMSVLAEEAGQSQVRSVDLYPPPIDWMPPNCILEVDNILQEWTWREKFDLIHIYLMLGSFTAPE
ncbi:hypothetical protein DTO039G3_7932 [Penicillium roqueforti]|nr:hypothetical protein CBS147318_5425 [Penicillium roqueforti]KAI3162549.1 hypothetical protein DTO039G3_7932 [Penicillium roqueforti]